jgi:FecR protein
MGPHRLCLAAVSLTLVLGSGTALAAPVGIGSAAAARDRVEGVLDGAAPRFINTGSEVYSTELVKTGDKGVARLVFLDNTDLAVGPRSEVKLDKFVYDPERKSGAVVINVTRGAFRFVTGTQDHRNYTITTPHGTLGVRGTTFELVVTNDRMDVHLKDGALEVKSSTNQTVVLTPNTVNSASVTQAGTISAFTVPANITILSFSTTSLGAQDANAGNQLGAGAAVGAGAAPTLGSSAPAPQPPNPKSDVSDLTKVVSE